MRLRDVCKTIGQVGKIQAAQHSIEETFFQIHIDRRDKPVRKFGKIVLNSRLPVTISDRRKKFELSVYCVRDLICS